MRPQALLQHSQLFAAKGPGYAIAYTRWRAIRLGTRLRQHLYPPAWSRFPALPAAGVAAGTPPDEAGPALATHLAARERPYFHFSVAEALAIAQQVPPEQRAHTLSVAEALLRGQHTYRGVRVSFDTAPDWQYAPSDFCE